jgi:riboflavin biosynthesis pyrimidine reductase
MGGARITASLIDAGLVDELRLIVYPLIAGEGKALFATTERRRRLELRKVQQLQGGRFSLVYGNRPTEQPGFSHPAGVRPALA